MLLLMVVQPVLDEEELAGQRPVAGPALGQHPDRLARLLLHGVGGFLQQVDYIGAIRDGNDTWWEGWTCGLPGTPSC